MALSGEQFQRLEAAMLAAFSESSLTRMMRFHLNENLDLITGSGPFTQVVFDLIRWAESQGRTAELVEAAHQFNPGNPALTAVWQELHAEGGQAGKPKEEEKSQPKSKEKVKFLFLAANSAGTGSIYLDEEFRAIQEKIETSKYHDKFEIVSDWAVRTSDLQDRLRRHDPDIVSISCHGTSQSALILQDRDGAPKEISKEALEQLFTLRKGRIKLVLLNACFSEELAKAIAQHISCAIGMGKEIGVKAAQIFSEAFYGSLAFGEDIATAYASGVTEIMIEGIPESDTPVLFEQIEGAAKLCLVAA